MAKTSPCVNICILDENDEGLEYCIGCHRTVEEIERWQTFSDQRKIELMKEIEQRDF